MHPRYAFTKQLLESASQEYELLLGIERRVLPKLTGSSAQAAASNESTGRGPVISTMLRDLLSELRGFRHVERNLYPHMLHAARVEENSVRLRRAFPAFVDELQAFLAREP